jgi:hypothetical protein
VTSRNSREKKVAKKRSVKVRARVQEPSVATPFDGSHALQDERLALIWREAAHAVERQATVVDEVRSRSCAILGSASLVAAFLTVGPMDAPRSSGYWLGAGAFCAVAIITALVLRPRSGWRFVRNPTNLLLEYVEGPTPRSLDKMHRDEALHLRNHYTQNAAMIKTLHRLLFAQTIAFGIEVLALASAYSVR